MGEEGPSRSDGTLELRLLALCAVFGNVQQALERTYRARRAEEEQLRVAATGPELRLVLGGGVEQVLTIGVTDLFPLRPVRLVGMTVEFALEADESGQGGLRMATPGPEATGLRKGVLTIAGQAEPFATLHIDEKPAWRTGFRATPIGP